MKYDVQSGKALMKKYLNDERLKEKLTHSNDVGEFAFKIAKKIKARNPELINLDPELVAFLGYTHDIGFSQSYEKHEFDTIDILIKEENVPENIAKMTAHYQMAERFGEEYLPIGIEGMILTYADMSIRTGKPIAIEKRADDIRERMKTYDSLPNNTKNEIIDSMDKAMPRFEKYEKIILALAGIESVNDF